MIYSLYSLLALISSDENVFFRISQKQKKHKRYDEKYGYILQYDEIRVCVYF